VQVAGYWWPASPPGWQPPTPLVDFLAAGPAPVFVGFGSMTPSHERLHHAIAVAVRRAGVRAVVQSGWAELGPAGDDILVVDDPPRSCLDRPTYLDRATELARPVRADDGPAAVLSLLTRLEGRPGQRL